MQVCEFREILSYESVESQRLKEKGMKRTAMIVVLVGTVLSISGILAGQGNDKPAATTTAPASGQAAAAPQGKRPPQAKTQAEFDAYKAAMGSADGAAAEKAADDFAAKFPDSELRVMVYKSAMQKYQQGNNADKMNEMAHKALTFDPDDPEALLGVSQILAERTRDTDLDKDDRLAEAKKDAEHALVTIDTDVPTTGYPPEQLNAYRDTFARRRTPSWARWLSTPSTGRMRRELCGSQLTHTRSSPTRWPCSGWRSRSTCRVKS